MPHIVFSNNILFSMSSAEKPDFTLATGLQRAAIGTLQIGYRERLTPFERTRMRIVAKHSMPGPTERSDAKITAAIHDPFLLLAQSFRCHYSVSKFDNNIEKQQATSARYIR